MYNRNRPSKSRILAGYQIIDFLQLYVQMRYSYADSSWELAGWTLMQSHRERIMQCIQFKEEVVEVDFNVSGKVTVGVTITSSFVGCTRLIHGEYVKGFYLFWHSPVSPV